MNDGFPNQEKFNVSGVEIALIQWTMSIGHHPLKRLETLKRGRE